MKRKEVTGKTIFARSRRKSTEYRQRCAGLFVLRGINPGALGAKAKVYRRADGKFIIAYNRITLPDGVSQWSKYIPDGLPCHHGKPHDVEQTRYIEVKWREVKA